MENEGNLCEYKGSKVDIDKNNLAFSEEFLIDNNIEEIVENKNCLLIPMLQLLLYKTTNLNLNYGIIYNYLIKTTLLN